MKQAIRNIPLKQIRTHRLNSNVMSEDLLAKLRSHIEQTGQYPPLIVRAMEVDRYEMLDGHHRLAVLKQLGHAAARCDVWQVNAERALVLLATLNRLAGKDDPLKRARLLRAAHRKAADAGALAKLLPETQERLKALRSLRRNVPPPRPPKPVAEQMVHLHLFFTYEDREKVQRVLAQWGSTREQGLLKLIDSIERK